MCLGLFYWSTRFVVLPDVFNDNLYLHGGRDRHRLPLPPIWHVTLSSLLIYELCICPQVIVPKSRMVSTNSKHKSSGRVSRELSRQKKLYLAWLNYTFIIWSLEAQKSWKTDSGFCRTSEVFTWTSEVFSRASEVFSRTSEVFNWTSEVFSRTNEVF